MPRPVLIPLLLAVLLALSACDSAEERAAKHFASAETLYADGDAERALVELRNVFKLDEDHLDGRRLHGEILEARGALAEAAASYDIVVEQTPDDADVHARLARLAITLRDRDRALRHATRAFEINPGPPLHRALYATVTYRDGDRPAAVEMARGVLAEDPASLLANTVLISAAMDAGDTAGALAQTDAALALNPDRPGPARDPAEPAGTTGPDRGCGPAPGGHGRGLPRPAADRGQPDPLVHPSGPGCAGPRRAERPGRCG